MSANSQSDYLEYRGKCKELAEQAVKDNPTLRLVRGHYLCPIWGQQAHWWAVSPDGTIVDPSVKQFPTAGVGAEYVEFDGNIECEFCHKMVAEEDAYMAPPHAYCSYECYGHDVGF
jgi:hypothetical protein